MENGDTPPGASGSRPTPDPTLLTTRQLIREVDAIKELYEVRFQCVDEGVKLHLEKIDVRFDGMDKAILLVKEIAQKIPSVVDEKIKALEGVQEVKFSSIGNQFDERDKRTEQLSLADKTAVAAALQAAKEAVGKQQETSDRASTKSELAFTKQLDQIVLMFQADAKSKDDKINDLKEQIVRLMSEKIGAATKLVETQAASNTSSLGAIGLAVGGLVGAGGIAATLVALFSKH